MSYDIIGDIHGHADKLVALLGKLGYRQHLGAWRHPDRTVIFVGDFVDRGPGQLDTLGIVRSMMDAGTAQAVMGNHEYNAIAWHTPDPLFPGEHLRRRNDKHNHQHEEFLAELDGNAALHAELVDWFRTLPLWLDLPGVRVVHACWDPRSMDVLAPRLAPGNRMTASLVEDASRPDSAEFNAAEILVKGIEVPLPVGCHFHDKDGNIRYNTRVRWWDDSAVTFRDSALLPPATRAQLPDELLPDWARIGYHGDKPVFFGHYWFTGIPDRLAPRVACVDYSAGRGGSLVAYRWDGETELRADRFVAT